MLEVNQGLAITRISDRSYSTQDHRHTCREVCVPTMSTITVGSTVVYTGDDLEKMNLMWGDKGVVVLPTKPYHLTNTPLARAMAGPGMELLKPPALTQHFWGPACHSVFVFDGRFIINHTDSDAASNADVMSRGDNIPCKFPHCETVYYLPLSMNAFDGVHKSDKTIIHGFTTNPEIMMEEVFDAGYGDQLGNAHRGDLPEGPPLKMGSPVYAIKENNSIDAGYFGGVIRPGYSNFPRLMIMKPDQLAKHQFVHGIVKSRGEKTHSLIVRWRTPLGQSESHYKTHQQTWLMSDLEFQGEALKVTLPVSVNIELQQTVLKVKPDYTAKPENLRLVLHKESGSAICNICNLKCPGGAIDSFCRFCGSAVVTPVRVVTNAKILNVEDKNPKLKTMGTWGVKVNQIDQIGVGDMITISTTECEAVGAYDAMEADELNVKAGDQFDLLYEIGDDRVKLVRKYSQNENGFVPRKKIQMPTILVTCKVSGVLREAGDPAGTGTVQYNSESVISGSNLILNVYASENKVPKPPDAGKMYSDIRTWYLTERIDHAKHLEVGDILEQPLGLHNGGMVRGRQGIDKVRLFKAKVEACAEMELSAESHKRLFMHNKEFQTTIPAFELKTIFDLSETIEMYLPHGDTTAKNNKKLFAHRGEGVWNLVSQRYDYPTFQRGTLRLDDYGDGKRTRLTNDPHLQGQLTTIRYSMLMYKMAKAQAGVVSLYDAGLSYGDEDMSPGYYTHWLDYSAYNYFPQGFKWIPRLKIHSWTNTTPGVAADRRKTKIAAYSTDTTIPYNDWKHATNTGPARRLPDYVPGRWFSAVFMSNTDLSAGVPATVNRSSHVSGEHSVTQSGFVCIATKMVPLASAVAANIVANVKRYGEQPNTPGSIGKYEGRFSEHDLRHCDSRTGKCNNTMQDVINAQEKRKFLFKTFSSPGGGYNVTFMPKTVYDVIVHEGGGGHLFTYAKNRLQTTTMGSLELFEQGAAFMCEHYEVPEAVVTGTRGDTPFLCILQRNLPRAVSMDIHDCSNKTLIESGVDRSAEKYTLLVTEGALDGNNHISQKTTDPFIHCSLSPKTPDTVGNADICALALWRRYTELLASGVIYTDWGLHHIGCDMGYEHFGVNDDGKVTTGYHLMDAEFCIHEYDLLCQVKARDGRPEFDPRLVINQSSPRYRKEFPPGLLCEFMEEYGTAAPSAEENLTNRLEILKFASVLECCSVILSLMHSHRNEQVQGDNLYCSEFVGPYGVFMQSAPATPDESIQHTARHTYNAETNVNTFGSLLYSKDTSLDSGIQSMSALNTNVLRIMSGLANMECSQKVVYPTPQRDRVGFSTESIRTEMLGALSLGWKQLKAIAPYTNRVKAHAQSLADGVNAAFIQLDEAHVALIQADERVRRNQNTHNNFDVRPLVERKADVKRVELYIATVTRNIHRRQAAASMSGTMELVSVKGAHLVKKTRGSVEAINRLARDAALVEQKRQERLLYVARERGEDAKNCAESQARELAEEQKAQRNHQKEQANEIAAVAAADLYDHDVFLTTCLDEYMEHGKWEIEMLQQRGEFLATSPERYKKDITKFGPGWKMFADEETNTQVKLFMQACEEISFSISPNDSLKLLQMCWRFEPPPFLNGSALVEARQNSFDQARKSAAEQIDLCLANVMKRTGITNDIDAKHALIDAKLYADNCCANIRNLVEKFAGGVRCLEAADAKVVLYLCHLNLPEAVEVLEKARRSAETLSWTVNIPRGTMYMMLSRMMHNAQGSTGGVTALSINTWYDNQVRMVMLHTNESLADTQVRLAENFFNWALAIESWAKVTNAQGVSNHATRLLQMPDPNDPDL